MMRAFLVVQSTLADWIPLTPFSDADSVDVQALQCRPWITNVLVVSFGCGVSWAAASPAVPPRAQAARKSEPHHTTGRIGKPFLCKTGPGPESGPGPGGTPLEHQRCRRLTRTGD